MRFLRSLRPSVWSSNVLALLALVIALGGGYAIARSIGVPPPATAYTATVHHQAITSAAPTLVVELPIPADGTYLAIGKLDVSSATSLTVSCHLGAIGAGDQSRVTVPAGGDAELTLLATGKPTPPHTGNTQAPTIVCQSSQAGPYDVSGRLVLTTLAGTASVTP